MKRTLALAMMLSVAGCSASDDSAVAVSVIGGQPRLLDPSRWTLDAPAEVLTSALAQGLVAFDAGGQVEPALAERWIVTDDGLSAIFRIRRTRWADGKPVTAQEVAQSLKAALSPRSRNPLRPALLNVTEILAMTEHVIELRLARPQPSLLNLLAQPEMAVLRLGVGSGPYLVHRRNENSVVLRPALPDKATEEATSEDLLRKSERHVRGERAGLAIARYGEGDVSLVLGGTFDNLHLARAARVSNAQFRRDPASGLFGLTMSRKAKALSSIEVRRALAMAIDRRSILRRFNVDNWQGRAALLPTPIESAADPALPDWVVLERGERLSLARAAIIAAMGGEDRELVLRVAMPDGPGGRLLFAQLAADWQRIGVRALRVAPKGEADIHLIDRVAAYGSAFWYFQQVGCTAGIQCSTEADAAVREAYLETDPQRRAAAIARADSALVSAQTFIPIAAPLRWSLVAPRLQGYRESPVAIHPLNRLMRPAR